MSIWHWDMPGSMCRLGKGLLSVKLKSNGTICFSHMIGVSVTRSVLSIFGILFMTMLLSASTIATVNGQKKDVTLNALVAEPRDRWVTLFGTALEELKERRPDLNITLNYTVLPYYDLKNTIESSENNNSLTNVDLYSVDQPWLGALVEKGLLEKLTQYTNVWNRSSDWNENNWMGGIYNNDVYGIWAWTDVRALWYWKDILNQSGIDPDSLRTWNGYLEGS